MNSTTANVVELAKTKAAPAEIFVSEILLDFGVLGEVELISSDVVREAQSKLSFPCIWVRGQRLLAPPPEFAPLLK